MDGRDGKKRELSRERQLPLRSEGVGGGQLATLQPGQIVQPEGFDKIGARGGVFVVAYHEADTFYP